ncbi:MAG: hypothetical protein LBS53_00680 [Synergistaceae bacterium]|jgi:hypothetical protein|nr:hypothetical protein [Synergistaceae bacterium]
MTTKSAVLKTLPLFLALTLALRALTGSPAAFAVDADIGKLLMKYYDDAWEVLKTEKSFNTGYGLYQKDEVYKSPARIYYIWSVSQGNDEEYFNSQVMGYASASNFAFLNDIAGGLAPGMPVSAVKQSFAKNDGWFIAEDASTLLDNVKPIPGETKIFYNDVAVMSSIAVSFKNGKACFVEYFSDGDRSEGKEVLESGGKYGAETTCEDAFVRAIEDMKRYEWQRPFNEWVWKAKSGGMDIISGGGLSMKGAGSGDLPGAYGAVYRASDEQGAVSVMFADIPGGKALPAISGGWRAFGGASGPSYPEYAINISRKNGRETVSFRKSLGSGEAWAIDCGRPVPHYREYRGGAVAVFNERAQNGGSRLWLVDMER